MAEKTYAVVTGANKGIGYEICKQLASNGVTVVLTGRDEKRGAEAAERLRECGVSTDIEVIFYQLDVTDSSSVASLADFVKTQFGRLDILVNNAGVTGSVADADALRASFSANEVSKVKAQRDGTPVNRFDFLTDSYEVAVRCLETNYYGAKRMVEAFLPLLELSNSPRIVNVSSRFGSLQHIPNEWAKSILRNIDNVTEEKLDEVIKVYLQDFKDGLLQERGWRPLMAYALSKAAINAYTRLLAKRYPGLQINCIHPGFVKTDITHNTGHLSAEEGAESVVKLALQPADGPSGLFFNRCEVASFE